ncbi:MAG: RluA family pseudouridine synthase [Phycisphaeraceae bacterium]|nr:RluA family pseudouridine synthase [Phycisphaeraceae bacterium]
MPPDESSVGPEHDETRVEGLILPGGQVDPEAVRRAWADADTDDGGAHLEFRLTRDLQTRLDRYLTARVGFMSRTQIQRLIDRGAAAVNGRLARAATRLRRGDVVNVTVPPPVDKRIHPEPIPIEVLYEDEYLIVLNKAPDIIVHPAKMEQTGTLLSALAWHVEQGPGGALSKVGEEFGRPGVVHRLDRRTSGCIVFAKHDQTHWLLGQQFEQRTVDKRYLAVVQGRLDPETDVIEAPIGQHPSRLKGYRERQVVRHDHLGRQAVTIYRVRERYRVLDRPVGDQDFSLVELELKTGRTHQIRVHMEHRGFPLVGDDLYEGRPYEHGGRTIIDRQTLHAALLEFTHPMTNQRMTFTAPLRPDMAELIRILRAADRVETSEAPGARVDLDRSLADAR